jgi:hypothetical protein
MSLTKVGCTPSQTYSNDFYEEYLELLPRNLRIEEERERTRIKNIEQGNQRRDEEIENAKHLFNRAQDFMETPIATEAYTKERISESIGSSPECSQTSVDQSLSKSIGAGYYETCTWEIRGIPIGAISYSYDGIDDSGTLIGIYKVEIAE